MVLGIVMLTLLVCLGAGIPVALLFDRARSWSVLAADALLAGFVIAGLLPTLYGWLGVAGAGLAGGAWLVAVVVVVVRRPGWPPCPKADRAGVVFVGIGATVAVLATVQRLHVVNFLPWVGDMGAYVNWANQFARTGELQSSWPPVLPAYLGMSSWIFGTEATTVPLAASGLVLLVAIARVLHLLTVNRWITLAAVTMLALHVHAVWYSNFPSSESLNAPYFVIWLATLIGALRSTRPIPWVAASGVVMLVLGLLRGTGPLLLLPLGAVAIAALVTRDWRHLAHRLWLIVAGNLAGALLSYWYGITEIRFYYVEFQLAALIPRSILNLLEPVTTPGPLAAAILLITEAAAIAAVLAAARIPRRPRPCSRGPHVVLVGLALILALGIAGTAVIRSATWEMVLRIGPVLFVGVVAALVLASSSRVPRRTAAFVVVPGSAVVMFYGLHTLRLGFHDTHSFYIYWDRYLVSEVLPAVVVLSALALDLGSRWAGRRFGMAWSLQRLAVPIAAFATLVVVVPQVPALDLVSRNSFFAGAYEFQSALESHVDDPKTPVVWAATSTDTVPNFFFPNTWMAFARPMLYTSGLDVIRGSARSSDFAPDEVLDDEAVAEALACSTSGEVLIYEVRNGGASLDDRITLEGVRLEPVATEIGRLSILSQRPDTDWVTAEFTVDVWTVSGPSTADCVH
jgi:hypothetical protein